MKAFHSVFETFLVRASEAEYQKKTMQRNATQRNECNAIRLKLNLVQTIIRLSLRRLRLQCPTLDKNAMSY